MFGKKVKKLLKKKSLKEKRKHKRRKHSSTSVQKRKKKKQFIDEELIATLKQRGYKPKPKPVQEAQVQEVNQKRRKVKQKQVQKKEAPSILKPLPTPPIVKEREIEIKQKPEPDTETKELSFEPTVEKKSSLFSKIISIFKKKPIEEKEEDIEQEVKPEEETPIEKELPKEEVKQIVEEVKPEEEEEEKKEEKKPEEPKEIITSLKEEIISAKIKESAPTTIKPETIQPEVKITPEIKPEEKEVEKFPVAEQDLKAKPKLISVFEEEPKKEWFFSRLFKKKVKDDDYELEPITISSPQEDTRFMKDASSTFGSNTESKTIAETLKQEIMPKQIAKPQNRQNDLESQQNQEPQNKERQHENSGASSIGILFDKKKKTDEK